MATYPASIISTTIMPNQVDGSSVVEAADVNLPYAEIIAIETVLGTEPATRDVSWGTGSFSTSTQAYSTVTSRIKNVENGAYTMYNSFNFSGTTATIHGGTSATF